MNLLKTFWNWFITPKADACCATPHESTPVQVEEITVSAAELFGTMCRAAGVKQRDLDSTGAIALFEAWYDGPPNASSVKESIKDFKVVYPKVNAKLAGRL
jgi:hypothetical protein|tara:strand:+ start:113 stop:415 length:303 start_codon:yes stop_codon:yes gene_type:complete